MNTLTALPTTGQVLPNRKMNVLLAELSPTTSWGNRQIAAKKLGYMRDPDALPALLQALLTDPYWMVRTAIIQALIMIDDPAAIPTLEEVASTDNFQIVQSYAKKAIEKLA